MTYRGHGDVGVEYEVSRFEGFTPSGKRRWMVQVMGWRPQPGQPSEKWLVVEESYDRQGKVYWKRPGVGVPEYEAMAARIARAVHEVF